MFSKTICGGEKECEDKGQTGPEHREKGAKEKGWRLEMGAKILEKRQTKKERCKEDTVSWGGLSEMGICEMIGGADLDRRDRGPPRNRV